MLTIELYDLLILLFFKIIKILLNFYLKLFTHPYQSHLHFIFKMPFLRGASLDLNATLLSTSECQILIL